LNDWQYGNIFYCTEKSDAKMTEMHCANIKLKLNIIGSQRSIKESQRLLYSMMAGSCSMLDVKSFEVG
jgi:hypothetical protein